MTRLQAFIRNATLITFVLSTLLWFQGFGQMMVTGVTPDHLMFFTKVALISGVMCVLFVLGDMLRD